MRDYQRDILLEKLDRDSGTLGIDIPEEIKINEEEIDYGLPDEYISGDCFLLKDYLLDLDKEDTVNESIDGVKIFLRKKINSSREHIKEHDISYSEGEKIVSEMKGVERALNTLRDPGESIDIEDEVNRKEKADQKRWLNFLRKATGNNNE